MSNRNETRKRVVAFCEARLAELGEQRTLALPLIGRPVAHRPGSPKTALVQLPEGEDEFLRTVIELLAPTPVRQPMSAPAGRLSRRFKNLELD